MPCRVKCKCGETEKNFAKLNPGDIEFFMNECCEKKPSKEQEKKADLNEDGKVDEKDASLMDKIIKRKKSSPKKSSPKKGKSSKK